RRDDGVSMRSAELFGLDAAIAAGRADVDDLCAERGGRPLLYLRRVLRHYDDGLRAQRARRIGHALRVVAAGVGDDSAAKLCPAELRDAVVCATKLEGPDGLLALGLDEKREGQLPCTSGAETGRIDLIQAGADGGAGNSLSCGANIFECDQ